MLDKYTKTAEVLILEEVERERDISTKEKPKPPKETQIQRVTLNRPSGMGIDLVCTYSRRSPSYSNTTETVFVSQLTLYLLEKPIKCYT